MHDEVRTATGLCSEEAQPVSGAGSAVRKSRWNTWLVMGLTDCGSSPLPAPVSLSSKRESGSGSVILYSMTVLRFSFS